MFSRLKQTLATEYGITAKDEALFIPDTAVDDFMTSEEHIVDLASKAIFETLGADVAMSHFLRAQVDNVLEEMGMVCEELSDADDLSREETKAFIEVANLLIALLISGNANEDLQPLLNALA